MIIDSVVLSTLKDHAKDYKLVEWHVHMPEEGTPRSTIFYIRGGRLQFVEHKAATPAEAMKGAAELLARDLDPTYDLPF